MIPLIPLDSDKLPDVVLLVEQGMSVTEALHIWANANQARSSRHRSSGFSPRLR